METGTYLFSLIYFLLYYSEKMKSISIGRKTIGPGYPVFIIAEAGVNHNGDVAIAKKMLREAKLCGVDCVKFQTFKAERIVTKRSPKANYQLKTTNPIQSQMEMLRQLELSEQDFIELSRICAEENILFLSTPYDIEDVDFLDNLGVEAFKVASGQAVEHYFLDYIARKNKPVLLSTGMCTLAEVVDAVTVIRAAGNDQIVVLQCTTNYPAAVEDVNLLAMVTMRDAMKVVAGYSDHTEGLSCATAAVALGASVIERHFTLDKSLAGPDHTSSSTPDELIRLVQSIREVETCLGNGEKIPCASELRNASVMRRSIVAAVDIAAGTVFSLENLTLKRPASGLLGDRLNEVLGKTSACDIKSETVIDYSMIK
jgi:N-acetylneuraminate synthase/N,N'-diacetyllegionaminate synthase